MQSQLEILLQLQDLKSQRRELSEGEAARAIQEDAFKVDVGQALEQLDATIRDMEAELSGPVRSRYQRVRGAKGRVVVPVIGGICYGCFIQVPTAQPSGPRRDELPTCENCGRFLYLTGA